MITDQQYQNLAIIASLEIGCIKAVEMVESSGAGPFMQDGRLRILFEAHQFWNALKKRGHDPSSYKSIYSNVLSPVWDRTLYQYGAKEWGRLMLACNIDKEAAYESASWGSFQVMGSNHSMCGFKDVFSFVDSLQVSAYNNVLAFLKFVENAGLVNALRNHKWAAFAKGYNGAGYAQNKYDTKMETAYKSFTLGGTGAIT
jgi:hypothetical protein